MINGTCFQDGKCRLFSSMNVEGFIFSTSAFFSRTSRTGLLNGGEFRHSMRRTSPRIKDHGCLWEPHVGEQNLVGWPWAGAKSFIPGVWVGEGENDHLRIVRLTSQGTDVFFSSLGVRWGSVWNRSDSSRSHCRLKWQTLSLWCCCSDTTFKWEKLSFPRLARVVWK